MPQYIDFYLSHNRYDKVIECLEDYCEKSDDFVEIEYVFYIIRTLTLLCKNSPASFKPEMNCTFKDITIFFEYKYEILLVKCSR